MSGAFAALRHACLLVSPGSLLSKNIRDCTQKPQQCAIRLSRTRCNVPSLDHRISLGVQTSAKVYFIVFFEFQTKIVYFLRNIFFISTFYDKIKFVMKKKLWRTLIWLKEKVYEANVGKGKCRNLSINFKLGQVTCHKLDLSSSHREDDPASGSSLFYLQAWLIPDDCSR